MCGITGAVWTSDGRAIEPATLDRMTDSLRHRGPDGRGTLLRHYPDGSGVALGHRRLAIIDLAGGVQPLGNEDGAVWITFNGEIYNFEELRVDLEAKGHRFQTHSDTETIVHLYEQYGDACVDKLRGMFAFAIWDEPRQRLFFARDRLGEKPFVYRESAGEFQFASEIKSLLSVPGVSREVDPESVLRYLTYFYVPHPHTMFRGVQKLPPAHCGVYEAGRLTIRRYWSPQWTTESTRPVQELREELAHELSESVRRMLRSDVPLGAFLSGGIDSTLIVGLMQRHLTRPAKTYTIGFDVEGFDERPFARRAAEYLGAEHESHVVEPNSIDILPRLVWHFDEPFGDSSAVPTWYVAQATRRHVTVALTGDGGDELFCGYPRYRTVDRLGSFDRLPLPLRKLVANPFWSLLPLGGNEQSHYERLRRRMAMLRESPGQRYVNWVAPYPRSQRMALLSPEFLANTEDCDVYESVAAAFEQSQGRAAGSCAMHADMQTYLPDDLLCKVDVTTMAHGLESRAPLLDHRVVELAISLPFGAVTQGEGPKPFFTSAFPGLIPPDLKQRGKAGFRIPLDRWFRSELREMAHDHLLSEHALGRGYFRPNTLREMLAQHDSGQWNHGDRIWALLFLEMWHRAFIDGDDEAGPPATVALSGVA
jgi:asparagine synthase (glutamine-hydrolysing)